MGEKMIMKFLKCWCEYSRILAVAVILDPRYKLNFVEWCYKKLYGDDEVVESMKVKNDLFSLFSEYVNAVNFRGDTSIGSSDMRLMHRMEIDRVEPPSAKDVLKEFDSFKCDDSISQKSQLKLYLDEPRMDRSIKLDVLAYWKGNQYKYPQITAMTRDVLAIPMTTIASESAFSNSGMVLDQYRSALKPDVVEALVCSRDWLFGDQDAKKLELEELTKDIMEFNLNSPELEQLDAPSCLSSSNSAI